MDKFIISGDEDWKTAQKAACQGKHIVVPANTPLHFDFIEVVHSKETFADKEYKKWLAERRRLI